MFRLDTLAALALLIQIPVSVADFYIAPDCTPAPDHSNYGLDKNGAWCAWSANSEFKPMGVGCKTDAECQRGPDKRPIYPFTNGKDMLAINWDIVAIMGVGFCDKNQTGGPGTQCNGGLSPVGPHPGGPSNIGPPASYTAFCREVVSKLGFPGAGIPAGCPVEFQQQTVTQCIYTCNGDKNTCSDPKADPKAPHRLYATLPSCPGYENVK